jgi:hypothetical protein
LISSRLHGVKSKKIGIFITIAEYLNYRVLGVFGVFLRNKEVFRRIDD